jgi:hypothetical protein
MSDVRHLGAQSAGIWTRAQARRVLSDGQIDELVRCGSWQVVWPGVYADGGYDLSAEQRAFARRPGIGRRAPAATQGAGRR